MVAHLKGQTRDNKLFNQTVFKLYHHAEYIDRMTGLGHSGTRQYYDDFEIWSDYPPGY